MKTKVFRSRNKNISVDFLYLDLNTCERCKASCSAIDQAVNELSEILSTLGYTITVNKIKITSLQKAKQYKFLSSPTIRVNGIDICGSVRENDCKDCGDLCGSNVDCRVFVYNGIQYDQPPKAMIIDGILKAIYAQNKTCPPTRYKIPKNLVEFFIKKKVK